MVVRNFFLNKNNKKGQFYLLASIIIVGILIGLISIQNYSFEKSVSNVGSFSEELKIEGKKVLDYDKKNGQNEFENFANNYSKYVGDSIEIYFIFGSFSNIEVYNYVDGIKKNSAFELNGNNLNVVLHGETYNFKLNKGDNFHFIMLESKDLEKHVIVGWGIQINLF